MSEKAIRDSCVQLLAEHILHTQTGQRASGNQAKGPSIISCSAVIDTWKHSSLRYLSPSLSFFYPQEVKEERKMEGMWR